MHVTHQHRTAFLSSVCVAAIVGLCVLSTSELRAQVRVDTTKKIAPKDSIGKGAPVITRDPLTDSLRADSLAQARTQTRIDSVARARLRDTIRSPMAHFESPRALDISNRLHFSREEILSSGALNLADLLDHVPGVTTFRTGWLAGIHAASLHGDFSRIRIFVDGIEMDATEARNGGALDLDDVPLWALDDLVIERAATEVRVWLRSWSVTSETPYTRADIFTGDRNTNAFRGFFARRYRNGAIVQIGAQQLATQTGQVSAFTTAGTTRRAGDGSQQVFNARFGWSRGRLSVDVYGTSSARDRDAQTSRKGFRSLPAFKGARRDGYVRVGYGDTLQGFWTQAMIGVARTRLEGIRDSVVSTDTTKVAVSSDTIGSRTQQVLAVGYRGRWFEGSLTDRARPINGDLLHAPALRLGLGTARLGVGTYVERRGIDSTTTMELFLRAAPTSWLVLTAAQGNRNPRSETDRPSVSSTRAEAAVRVRRLWIGGGAIRENPTVFNTPVILSFPSVQLAAAKASGVLGSIRGPVYKDLSLDVQTVRWNASQYGRPPVHIRGELALVSEWRSKFPKGQFGFNARVIYDRRNSAPFYFGVGADQTVDTRFSERAEVITAVLQIRIQRASIFYQYRNLTGGDYEQIPGLTMPRQVQVYGVRWEFAN